MIAPVRRLRRDPAQSETIYEYDSRERLHEEAFAGGEVVFLEPIDQEYIHLDKFERRL